MEIYNPVKRPVNPGQLDHVSRSLVAGDIAVLDLDRDVPDLEAMAKQRQSP